MNKVFKAILLSIILMTSGMFISCFGGETKELYTIEYYDGEKLLYKLSQYEGKELYVYKNTTKDDLVFVGWDINGDNVYDELPKYVNENIKAYAIYASETDLKVTFVNSDDSVLKIVYVHKGEDANYPLENPTIPSTVDKVFTFSKWDKAYTNVQTDLIVKAIYEESIRKYTYTFMNGEEKLKEEIVDYNTSIEAFENQTKARTEKNYYVFLGWDYNDDKIVDEFPINITSDLVINAIYDELINKYTYKLYNKNEMIKEETIEYESIINYPTFEKAYKSLNKYYLFIGWDYNNDGEVDELIEKLTGDLTGNAVYSNTQLVIMHYDGKVYLKYFLEGETLTLYEPELGSNKQCVWYTDNTFVTPLASFIMPKGNLELYGQTEDAVTLDTSILDYIWENQTINNLEELQSLYNYLVFINAPSTVIKLGFEYTDSMLTTLMDNCTLALSYKVKTSYSKSKDELTLNLEFNEINKLTNNKVYEQYKCLNALDYPNTHGSNLNNFYIDSVQKTCNVSNSEQLYYCLEHGYRPIIDENNTELSSLYNEMKKVLALIIDSDMTSYDKLLAIYEWMINEVTYDKELLSKVSDPTIENIHIYKGFYMDGVFIDKLAVCDGISKSYAALANMVGIPCIRVTGSGANNNHAWNKAFLDGKWYVIDATSGGTISESKYEIMTYNFFLISDEYFSQYYTENKVYYSDIVATNNYDYYEKANVLYLLKKYDLKCENLDEAVTLFNWFFSMCESKTTFEIEIAFDYGDSFSDEMTEISYRCVSYSTVSYFINNKSLTIIKK